MSCPDERKARVPSQLVVAGHVVVTEEEDSRDDKTRDRHHRGGGLVIGFGAGLVLGPVISPVAASPAAVAGVAQPTEEEAAAAARRHRLFTGISLANETLKLGDCSPGGVGPGITCMTQLAMDATKPNATPQSRSIGFARVDSQWEVAGW
jgi:hypothetical protein